MKKITLPLIAIALATPGAALAQSDDAGPYIAVDIGAALPSDSSNSGATTAEIPETDDFGAIPSGTPVGWETEFDNGLSFSGAAGYDFGNGFRAEVQAFYTEYDVDTHSGVTVSGANIDAVDVAVLTRGEADDDNPTVGAVVADGQGDISSYGAFLNVFYDIETGAGIEPYIGGGIGYVETDIDYSPSGVTIADASDGGFAYQAIAGASFNLSDNAQIFAQYTYRDSLDDVEVPLTLLPADLEIETGQSIVSAGVRIKFGS
ncbi:MAG: outer membrane beta-barrel protein [Pseudomonadota bacterium]